MSKTIVPSRFHFSRRTITGQSYRHAFAPLARHINVDRLRDRDPPSGSPTRSPKSYAGVTLDPSKGKESKFGDYSAFVKVMYDHYEGKIYVDAEMGRWNTDDIVQRAIDIQLTFTPHAFGIETNQFQSLLAEEITRQAQSRGLLMPMHTIENYDNKIVRIRMLTPFLARGMMRFKGDSPGARLLVEQLRDFPLADHDDGPDSLEMAMRLINHMRREVVEPEELIICA